MGDDRHRMEPTARGVTRGLQEYQRSRGKELSGTRRLNSGPEIRMQQSPIESQPLSKLESIRSQTCVRGHQSARREFGRKAKEPIHKPKDRSRSQPAKTVRGLAKICQQPFALRLQGGGEL